MSIRTLIHTALTGREPLLTLINNEPRRIIQASAVGHGFPGWEGTPPRPFLTYRFHTGFPAPRTARTGRREYLQIWANDDPGDYSVIDEILEECRLALESIPHQGDFLEAVWIETGVELQDIVMGTINRYIRFQITRSLRT